MNVSITIPDSIANKIKSEHKNLKQLIQEAFTIEAYRNGMITEKEVQELLNLETRLEANDFLKKANSYISYTTEKDLQNDIDSIQKATYK